MNELARRLSAAHQPGDVLQTSKGRVVICGLPTIEGNYFIYNAQVMSTGEKVKIKDTE